MGINLFFPDQYVESTYKIAFADFYKRGYRGIIFDIDNTLVRHGEPATEKSISFLNDLQALGYEVILLSNNKEPRVKSFADKVGVGYIYKASKPSPVNYRKAMERMHTTQTNTVFVGDQIFTDIWGAKKAGIYAILTKPIDPREEIQIVIKRFLEKPVLWAYEKSLQRENEDEKNG